MTERQDAEGAAAQDEQLVTADWRSTADLIDGVPGTARPTPCGAGVPPPFAESANQRFSYGQGGIHHEGTEVTKEKGRARSPSAPWSSMGISLAACRDGPPYLPWRGRSRLKG